jgi:hypothetical protein
LESRSPEFGSPEVSFSPSLLSLPLPLPSSSPGHAPPRPSRVRPMLPRSARPVPPLGPRARAFPRPRLPQPRCAAPPPPPASPSGRAASCSPRARAPVSRARRAAPPRRPPRARRAAPLPGRAPAAAPSPRAPAAVPGPAPRPWPRPCPHPCPGDSRPACLTVRVPSARVTCSRACDRSRTALNLVLIYFKLFSRRAASRASSRDNSFNL